MARFVGQLKGFQNLKSRAEAPIPTSSLAQNALRTGRFKQRALTPTPLHPAFWMASSWEYGACVRDLRSPKTFMYVSQSAKKCYNLSLT